MTAEKDVQVARKKGRVGGEVIWAMPERKHSFLKEVFPYGANNFSFFNIVQMTFDPPLPSLVFNVHVAVFWCKMVSLMKRKKNTACYWKGKILVSSSSSYSSFITLHNLASTINVTEWIACSHNLHHIPLINPAPILPPISTQKRNQKFYYVIKCKIIWCAAISLKTVFL